MLGFFDILTFSNRVQHDTRDSSSYLIHLYHNNIIRILWGHKNKHPFGNFQAPNKARNQDNRALCINTFTLFLHYQDFISLIIL
jgi:hypothetical protein